MKKDQEYRADALNRTRDFIGVHADAVAGLADSEGMKQLDGSIVALAGFSNQQAARANLPSLAMLPPILMNFMKRSRSEAASAASRSR